MPCSMHNTGANGSITIVITTMCLSYGPGIAFVSSIRSGLSLLIMTVVLDYLQDS